MSKTRRCAMTSVSSIAAMQSSIFLTAKKHPAPQTVATPQPQPAANASSTTISQAAQDLASQPASDPSLQSRVQMIQNAENDPVYAKKQTEYFANYDGYEKHGPMVDI